MNSSRLKDLIKNEKTNISIEEYRIRYATERFLARIEESFYKDKLVLKGGFLLGTIFKVEQRTTKDLDTLMKEIKADKESVNTMLQNIISIDLNDSVKFVLIELIESQHKRIYTGFKAKLEMQFVGETSIVRFDLDLGVGDTVTPEAQLVEIPILFNEKKGEKKSIKLLAYPLETILAEKTETILNLGLENSRMKDFYDIHLILNDPGLPNIENCYNAFKNTWNFRHSNIEINDEQFEDWNYIIDEISQDKDMSGDKWDKYKKDRDYAKDLMFNDIIQDFKCYIKTLHNFYQDSKGLEKSTIFEK